MYKIRLYVVPEEESEDNNNNNKNNEDDDDNVIPIMQRKNSRRATTGAIRVNVISKNRKSKKLKLKDDQGVSIDVKHKNKLNGYKVTFLRVLKITLVVYAPLKNKKKIKFSTLIEKNFYTTKIFAVISKV